MRAILPRKPFSRYRSIDFLIGMEGMQPKSDRLRILDLHRRKTPMKTSAELVDFVYDIYTAMIVPDEFADSGDHNCQEGADE